MDEEAELPPGMDEEDAAQFFRPRFPWFWAVATVVGICVALACFGMIGGEDTDAAETISKLPPTPVKPKVDLNKLVMNVSTVQRLTTPTPANVDAAYERWEAARDAYHMASVDLLVAQNNLCDELLDGPCDLLEVKRMLWGCRRLLDGDDRVKYPYLDTVRRLGQAYRRKGVTPSQWIRQMETIQ